MGIKFIIYIYKGQIKKIEIRTFENVVYSAFSTTLKFALLYNFTRATASLKNKLLEKHNKKLVRLRNEENDTENKKNKAFFKQTVHNFSSYTLTSEERVALSHGLD